MNEIKYKIEVWFILSLNIYNKSLNIIPLHDKLKPSNKKQENHVPIGEKALEYP